MRSGIHRGKKKALNKCNFQTKQFWYVCLWKDVKTSQHENDKNEKKMFKLYSSCSEWDIFRIHTRSRSPFSFISGIQKSSNFWCYIELPATLANCTTTYFHHHIQGRSHKIHRCSRSANCHWALHYLSTCDSISSAYGWTSKTGRLWPLLFPCSLLYTPQRGSRCCPGGLDRLCSLPRHTLGISKKLS